MVLIYLIKPNCLSHSITKGNIRLIMYFQVAYFGGFGLAEIIKTVVYIVLVCKTTL